MRKAWMLVTVAVLAIYMVAGCVGKAEKTYTDPEQLIDIGVNEAFVIALDCDDTYPLFSWQINYDATMLVWEDRWFEVSRLKLFGTESFKFKALKPGETEITMVYMKFKEPEEPEEVIDKKVFTVNIK